MTSRDEARSRLVQALGDIVLEEGLNAFSLRRAAARLDTSDRMLLYYFGTKNELMAETLSGLSGRLALALGTLPAAPPMDVLRQAIQLLCAPDIRPFITLWHEICVQAVREGGLYEQIRQRSVAFWIDWIMGRTIFPAGIEPLKGARGILVVIEGVMKIGLDQRDALVLVDVLAGGIFYPGVEGQP